LRNKGKGQFLRGEREKVNENFLGKKRKLGGGGIGGGKKRNGHIPQCRGKTDYGGGRKGLKKCPLILRKRGRV